MKSKETVSPKPVTQKRVLSAQEEINLIRAMSNYRNVNMRREYVSEWYIVLAWCISVAIIGIVIYALCLAIFY